MAVSRGFFEAGDTALDETRRITMVNSNNSNPKEESQQENDTMAGNIWVADIIVFPFKNCDFAVDSLTKAV